MPPTRTIKKKTKKMAGLKLAKSRSTVFVGGNAQGDMKLKPFWIHKSENPRCFQYQIICAISFFKMKVIMSQ